MVIRLPVLITAVSLKLSAIIADWNVNSFNIQDERKTDFVLVSVHEAGPCIEMLNM